MAKVQTIVGHQSKAVDSNPPNIGDEAPSLFEVANIPQGEQPGYVSAGPDDLWQEVNCIYILDDRGFDVALKVHGKSVKIDMSSFKISSPQFEMLAAGLWTMIPTSLGIEICETKYFLGFRIDGTAARCFARLEFKPEILLQLEKSEIQRRVQICVDLLSDRSLWSDDRMKDKPAAQILGLIERAREVRGQLGTRELPATCTVCGRALIEPIKIERTFGVPKPVVIEDVLITNKGEVRGFHGEFHLMHFVFGCHRKVVDIGFDESIYKDQVVQFSVSDKKIVEAKWIERREDEVVKSLTLTGLRLVQDTLFNMPK